MWMSCPPPNVGPYDRLPCIEWLLLELYFPVWGSLTGTHPGLFTSENKKAFESYRYPEPESTRKYGWNRSVIRDIVLILTCERHSVVRYSDTCTQDKGSWTFCTLLLLLVCSSKYIKTKSKEKMCARVFDYCLEWRGFNSHLEMRFSEFFPPHISSHSMVKTNQNSKYVTNLMNNISI